MSTATLNGMVCTRVEVHLPAWGLWWADCETDGDSSVPGSASIQLADLTLRGTVVSGGARHGRGSWRIVGGAGGWSKPLPQKSYANDAGVKIGKVLSDAATECGETIENAPTGVLGPAFARLSGPASAVLNLTCPQSWYVAEDGVTRFGRRQGVSIPASVARGRVDFSSCSVELMADSIATILPGCTCEGITAVDVVHTLDANRLRSTIYGSAFGPTTKRLLAWSRLIEQMRPFERYRGVWEYRIVNQSSERLDLQPVASRFGLPDLLRVPVRAGVPGCKARHALGSLVLVAFVNSDPSRPCVVGFDDPSSPGFVPDELDLVGEDDTGIITDTSKRVVRYGDTIMVPVSGVETPVVLAPNPIGGSLSRVRA